MNSSKSAAGARKIATGGNPPPSLEVRIDELLMAGETNIEERIIGDVRREAIRLVMRHTNCHLSRSSQILGISRKTLRKRLVELGISPEEILPDARGREDHRSGGKAGVPA